MRLRRDPDRAVPFARNPMSYWLRRSPFLALGLSSFIFLLILGLELPIDSGFLRGIAVIWRFLGFGPHLTANLLARWAPDLPGWLDALLVVLLGLLPYLAADALLARRRRLPRARQADQGEESLI